MEAGQECYLYNVKAEGFLVGANDYGTRASVGATLGHKVKIEQGTTEAVSYTHLRAHEITPRMARRTTSSPSPTRETMSIR